MTEEGKGIDPRGHVADGSDRPPSVRAGSGRARPVMVALLLAGLIGMVLALFLPWATAAGSGQGLAQYGAPGPTIVAWVLLALGLATFIVSVGSFIFGSHGARIGAGAGAVLYGCGAGLWYFASVLPSVVASGCQANGGPLCRGTTSPVMTGEGVASGFVLALVASAVVVAVVGVALGLNLPAGRRRPERSGPQP